MNQHTILDKYIRICHENLMGNNRILSLLRKQGLFEQFILENYRIGYSDGSAAELITANPEINKIAEKIKLIKNKKDVFTNHLIIPVYNEDKVLINLTGYNIHPQTKNRVLFLNNNGIFNSPYLKNTDEIIFTSNPLEALLLIQNDFPNITFPIGDDNKYISFIQQNNIKNAVFTFNGKERLFYDLTKLGISNKRIIVDTGKIINGNAKTYLENIFNKNSHNQTANDIIQEIENGFLFRFQHLNYRIIGNFSEYTLSMKANIKVFINEDVFVDVIDLYKKRDRQNFVFNVMDHFNLRDQTQLENDLKQIINVIDSHKQKKENEKKKKRPELTDYQKSIGLKFLKNPKLIDEIDQDITDLGYVNERKNKLILYLIMTSRLLSNPLQCIILSRSSAGKSNLVDIIEKLCPEEELVSISDLSPQSFYYFGENDLKHKFIVIGEKVGSESSDYPIRELISKKSISKAVPVKDVVSGEVKTKTIRVFGPISFCETGTSQVNEENLTRYFVLSIDESTAQTLMIHEQQRFSVMFEGYLKSLELDKIIQKHIFAQRQLRPLKVFIPFADKLKFPADKLKTRRDNLKFLRLITVICFLHQYQRKIKKHKLKNNQTIEYIEATPDDYRIAYDLLKDGILDNTLDDIPRQAKELLTLIKNYLQERSKNDKIPEDKIIFTRKQIREFSNWTFVQIRNNFKVLKDYEYIQVLPNRNGQAHQYRLSPDYKDIDVHNLILRPEEL